jgi:hypothetical protein
MDAELTAIVFGTVFSGVGLLLTGAGLLYAARQLRLGHAVARTDTYLKLDELLQQHKEVYLKLYPDPQGEWGDRESGPSTVEEWCSVVIYMGLFERIKVLADLGTVDLAVIGRLYAYRIQDIVNNRVIFQKKCVEQAEYWKDFNALRYDLGIKPQGPSEGLGAGAEKERKDRKG